MRRLIFASSLMACVLAACGSAQSKNQQHDDFKSAAVKAAHGAVFTLADMPPGWTNTPVSGGELSATFENEFKACSGFTTDDEAATNGTGKAKSDSLKGPAVETTSLSVSIFDTPAKAAFALNRMTAAYSNCDAAFKALMETVLHEGKARGADSTNWEVSYTDRNIAKLGDQSKGFRLKAYAPATGATVLLEFQFVRVGHANAFVTSSVIFSEPADGEEAKLDAYPRLAESKLSQAEKSLP